MDCMTSSAVSERLRFKGRFHPLKAGSQLVPQKLRHFVCVGDE